MPENTMNNEKPRMDIRHRGRAAQVPIYLGKLIRMFVYQNDWKVLPMSALIAGLVGIVIRTKLFISMEGTLMGAFALSMVCIWNGCFNSIQVICRERDVIKREHRSGMHISSYIVAHMIYQALICLLQAIITLYVTALVGVRYPVPGLISHWMMVDFGISIFLITYAADMLSLFLSSFCKSTTTAMTIMPFVLIFQLVFSGGMFELPQWAEAFTPLTISEPGLDLIASLSDYNSQPVETIWKQLVKTKNRDFTVTVTTQDMFNVLQDERITPVAEMRKTKITDLAPVKWLRDGFANDLIDADDPAAEAAVTAAVSAAADDMGRDDMTIGELIDVVAEAPEVQAIMDESFTLSTTGQDLIDIIGEDKLHDLLTVQIGKTNYNPKFEYSQMNVAQYWARLLLLTFIFAALATILLEFVDKDKR